VAPGTQAAKRVVPAATAAINVTPDGKELWRERRGGNWMMDLSTTYLGLALPHPLMPGASPMVDDLDLVKRLEDAGAAAIVMHSLFEEQIAREDLGMEEASAELLSASPQPEDFALAPDRYLEQVQRIKTMIRVPLIASINGTKRGGWLRYARQIQEAGADALELNFYHVPTDPRESGAETERRLLDLVRHVKWSVTIPVAVKLSPFYSSLPHLARELDALRVDGLVLFNRFFQPDIDPEMLLAVPRVPPSSSDELLLRVRWLAILHGRVEASLAITGGVHTGMDALKAIMAGAQAVQVVTALLNHGPQHLIRMRRDLEHWLEEHEYESLRRVQGSVSLLRSADPEVVERGNYLKILQTWYPRSIPSRSTRS
jgi:dihydroorotate dehydrogenase (fumarate)